MRTSRPPTSRSPTSTGFRPLQLERLFAVVVRTGGGGGVVVPKLDARPGRGRTRDARARLLRRLLGRPDRARRPPRRRREIGVEEGHIVFARSSALSGRGLELSPSGAVIADLRARKDETEVEAVRGACALVERSYAFAWNLLRPGISERELNVRVEAFLRDEGASASHPLVLFGANAANPHADPSDECSCCRRRGLRRHLRLPSTATGATSRGAQRSGRRPNGRARCGRSYATPRPRRSPSASPACRARDVELARARDPRDPSQTSARCSTAPGMQSASRSMSRRSSFRGIRPRLPPG